VTFSEIIRARRKALNLTQSDLATTLNVSQRYISAIEAGVSDNPTLETIREFATALHLEVADLEPLLAISTSTSTSTKPNPTKTNSPKSNSPKLNSSPKEDANA
jgi:transcriptional regulator with XRE-family HTH domain